MRTSYLLALDNLAKLIIIDCFNHAISTLLKAFYIFSVNMTEGGIEIRTFR
jgi:hypothetical protein